MRAAASTECEMLVFVQRKRLGPGPSDLFPRFLLGPPKRAKARRA
jgi:hypothetical protein